MDERQGHTPWVRASHWIGAASLLVLAVTGFVILMAHPRLYWGEVGNDLTPALIELPISRNHQHGGWDTPKPFFAGAGAPVSASRTYDIFNQNGWGRSLHFLPRGASSSQASSTCSGGCSGAIFVHTSGLARASWRHPSCGATSSITCACGFRRRRVDRGTTCCRRSPIRP